MTSERPRAAMIMAAGRGERMRPLTDTTPKPLLWVHGQPLIERHVERLVHAGIERIAINLAWLGGQIRDYLGDGTRFGAAITYSEEAPRALDSGGGVFRALPILSPGPFAVVNGDIYTDFPFQTLAIDAKYDSHLVLVPNPSYMKGDFGFKHGEALASADELFTFGSIAVYRSAFFADSQDGVFPIMPLWRRSMAAGRCSAQLYTGVWEDVGTPERLAALNTGRYTPSAL
jgi:N-acetyl-alpha-D-muramate 1-phosphate uridylyltransferase